MKRIPKVGDIVLYKVTIRDGEKTSPEYPAIVYKVYPDSEWIGMTVFNAGVPERLDYIKYSATGDERRWRFLEDVENK